MPRLRDRGFQHPVPSEITSQRVYQQRRDLLRWMAAGAAGASLATWASRQAMAQPGQVTSPTPAPGRLQALPARRPDTPGGLTDERLTSYEDITSYNNFYEFGLDKSDPARHAHRMAVRPWIVKVEGEVGKPGTYDIDDLLKLAPMEERIYRMRCVEGWSMVIPWVGYPLSALIEKVQPTGNAKYVAFDTLADRQTMPGLRSSVLEWPYTEGLRMDEAMHPLTLLTFGLYGEILPNQNGAPVRMVVPWKYGFKSGKSIVRIRFTEQQPRTSWLKAAPQEYGFYSNVNPQVNHPRWSQATERRIGEDGLFTRRRPTLMYNGYEEQVGQLYAGMDLRKHY